MYKISFSGRFKKDFKLCKKRGYDIENLHEVIVIADSNIVFSALKSPNCLVLKILTEKVLLFNSLL